MKTQYYTAGSAWPYAQPTWVFTSRKLPGVDGADVRFVRGAGLLDEVILQIGSVALGRGKPLLPRRITSPPLRLLSARQIGTGFAELRYQVPRS